MKGKVWIVGAGPADIDMMTRKGSQILKEAEVVVYDHLVDISILMEIPSKAEVYNAGKQAGCHLMPQQEINELLVKKAKEGKRVVRLKGGDPFVFGRGAEEVEALIREEIPYEVIPGISSAIAVPAYGGIPITHRDYASSFYVITAHRRHGDVASIDYKKLVRLGEGVTLVFLMGVNALTEICEGLRKAGMDQDQPAAIIQNGGRYDQRQIVGTVSNLANKAEVNKIQSPAIILVGRVCCLADKMEWRKRLPLSGKRVLVTRPEEKGSKLAELLKEKGAAVLNAPMITILPWFDEERLNRLKAEISSYRWIAFTSETAVHLFFGQIKEAGIDVRKMASLKFGVIGEATGRALEEHGFFADVMPELHSGEQLANEIMKRIKEKERVLVVVPQNQKSSCKNALIEGSKRLFFQCDVFPVYQTDYNRSRFFEWREDDIVTFASSSAVEGFIRNIQREKCELVNAVCIGKHTYDAALKYKMKAVVSEDTTMESLVRKVLELTGGK